MNFYKSSFYSSMYTLINMISGLIITKITATMVGPSGTAYVGEFGNVVVILSLLSTASIGTGIVKYVSEYKNKPNELKKLIQTAFGLILMFSIPISLRILFSSNFLTVWTFGNLDFRIVFILLGFLFISISMYQLFVGMWSGF